MGVGNLIINLYLIIFKNVVFIFANLILKLNKKLVLLNVSIDK